MSADRLTEREIEMIVNGRHPADDPRPGDVVRSFYPSIGGRRVVSVNECGVRYVRLKPNGIERDGYCLPGIWRKWCRAHRVTVVQVAESASPEK